MKYIQTYDNFKPIKINGQKPFKIKKNIDKSIKFLQTGIKTNRKKLDNDNLNDPKRDKEKRSKLNKNKNDQIQKLKDLTFKQLKQAEYLRNNPVKENYDSDEGEDLVSVLSSPDFKPEDIEKYIGLKPNEFDFGREYNYSWHKSGPNYDEDGFTILLKSETLEDLMFLDSGTLNWFLQFTGYNDYEYYVDDDELNYLYNYLPTNIIEKIKKLSELFDTNIDIEEEEYNSHKNLPELFEYLGLKDKLNDFKCEISMENERAIQKTACDELKKLPFDLNGHYTGDYNLELVFEYKDLIEYLKTHNIKAKTIKDVLENIHNADDFKINEYEMASENVGDFKDLKHSVEEVVDKYLESPDELFIKIIEIDNIEVFKNKVDLADFEYVYDVWIDFNREEKNLFELAKHYNGKILDWIKTDKFGNIMKNRSKEELSNYREFMFREDIEKYNV